MPPAATPCGKNRWRSPDRRATRRGSLPSTIAPRRRVLRALSAADAGSKVMLSSSTMRSPAIRRTLGLIDARGQQNARRGGCAGQLGDREIVGCSQRIGSDRASPRAHWPIGSVRRVRRPWQCAPDKRAQAAPRAKARMSAPLRRGWATISRPLRRQPAHGDCTFGPVTPIRRHACGQIRIPAAQIALHQYGSNVGGAAPRHLAHWPRASCGRAEAAGQRVHALAERGQATIPRRPHRALRAPLGRRRARPWQAGRASSAAWIALSPARAVEQQARRDRRNGFQAS